MNHLQLVLRQYLVLDCNKYKCFETEELTSVNCQDQGYGVEPHFQQYFSYIMAVSFIGGENQSTRIKPPHDVSHGQTLSHNVVSEKYKDHSI
jgi:hypothetical protein